MTSTLQVSVQTIFFSSSPSTLLALKLQQRNGLTPWGPPLHLPQCTRTARHRGRRHCYCGRHLSKRERRGQPPSCAKPHTWSLSLPLLANNDTNMYSISDKTPEMASYYVLGYNWSDSTDLSTCMHFKTISTNSLVTWICFKPSLFFPERPSFIDLLQCKYSREILIYSFTHLV